MKQRMKINIELIERVLDEKATPEEAKIVTEWFSKEEGQEFLSRYIADELEGVTEEKALSWVDHSIPERQMKKRFLDQMKRSKKKKSRRNLLLVAVLIPFLFLGVSVTFLAGRAGIFSETKYAEVSVPFGERMKVMLQDGTVVLLNSGTKLRYPQKFSLFKRKVELLGEGYFEVAKMKMAPFIIDLKGVSVEVTGTKFNVKSYADDGKVWVALEEGGVRLKDSKSLEYSLVPGEQVEYDRVSGKCSVEHIKEGESLLTWRDGSLCFYLTPLSGILKVLERQYDVFFVVGDSTLLNSKFTLSTAKVNVVDVLKDLETVSNIAFHEVKEGIYEVTSKKE